MLYTDGSCAPTNPGAGGFAFLRVSKDESTVLSASSHSWSTNNRMELQAAIAALETCADGERVELHTDSQYVKNGITNWIHAWKANGWRRGKAKKEVLNVNLWRRLDQENQRLDVEWRWVKAHAGNQFNEIVDQAARQAAFEAHDAIREISNDAWLGHTDGAQPLNQVTLCFCVTQATAGQAAWAFEAALANGEVVCQAGAQCNVTYEINTLTGALTMLRKVPKGSTVDVVTDSGYLYDFVTNHRPSLQLNNWQTTANTPPQVLEYWQQLDEVLDGLTVEWFYTELDDNHVPLARVKERAEAALLAV